MLRMFAFDRTPFHVYGLHNLLAYVGNNVDAFNNVTQLVSIEQEQEDRP